MPVSTLQMELDSLFLDQSYFNFSLSICSHDIILKQGWDNVISPMTFYYKAYVLAHACNPNIWIGWDRSLQEDYLYIKSLLIWD